MSKSVLVIEGVVDLPDDLFGQSKIISAIAGVMDQFSEEVSGILGTDFEFNATVVKARKPRTPKAEASATGAPGATAPNGADNSQPSA
jgi:hypothetical protein